MSVLMSVFRTLIKYLIKKKIMKKKSINVLIIFFIFYKSDIKIFLKLIVNKCP